MQKFIILYNKEFNITKNEDGIFLIWDSIARVDFYDASIAFVANLSIMTRLGMPPLLANDNCYNLLINHKRTVYHYNI